MIYLSYLKEHPEEYPNLPQEFIDALPDSCPYCGGELAMSEILTGLSCQNRKCISKLVMRIKSICKDLNITDFGESTIEKFIEYYNVTNPLDIFELEMGMKLSDDVSDKVSNKVISQIEAKKDFTLWEYVMYANIPFVRTSARSIFQGYKNLTEAYADIEEGGPDFIAKKIGLNIDDGTNSIQANKIYVSLIENKDDLLENESYVRIKNTDKLKELNVVCSDQVGNGFAKKAEFYAYCKENFGDRFQFNFLGSVTKNIDYLVWAGADGSPARYTSKVQKVERYNEKGSNIPIVTASQFIEELESM